MPTATAKKPEFIELTEVFTYYTSSSVPFSMPKHHDSTRAIDINVFKINALDKVEHDGDAGEGAKTRVATDDGKSTYVTETKEEIKAKIAALKV